ncbi:hypothetical protein BB347_04980 [Natronorubrum daqingense]|uniref:Uncharacterized protein n=1 Tax=Natronorubrum daqingense TaxID=588898 RepID=A0A1P8RBS9_9EURY|nr:hypothetical protein BB347_04980 [Natronorubrum daqingense]
MRDAKCIYDCLSRFPRENMLETFAIVLLFVSVGVLLFLPTIAISWWQSRERDERDDRDSSERTRE